MPRIPARRFRCNAFKEKERERERERERVSAHQKGGNAQRFEFFKNVVVSNPEQKKMTSNRTATLAGSKHALSESSNIARRSFAREKKTVFFSSSASFSSSGPSNDSSSGFIVFDDVSSFLFFFSLSRDSFLCGGRKMTTKKKKRGKGEKGKSKAFVCQLKP